MSGVLVMSKGGLSFDVELRREQGRVSIDAGLFLLSMTVDEARILATKLQNAAVQSAPLVELDEAA